jgi:hypothetical protein
LTGNEEVEQSRVTKIGAARGIRKWRNVMTLRPSSKRNTSTGKKGTQSEPSYVPNLSYHHLEAICRFEVKKELRHSQRDEYLTLYKASKERGMPYREGHESALLRTMGLNFKDGDLIEITARVVSRREVVMVPAF